MSKYIPWVELKVGDKFGPVELPYVERYFTCEMEELRPDPYQRITLGRTGLPSNVYGDATRYEGTPHPI